MQTIYKQNKRKTQRLCLSYRPTQKYKCMKKTKAVSVLQTHTEIQIYEKTQRLCLSYRPTQKSKFMRKGPKTMTVLCFTNCKHTHTINNCRKRKKNNNKVQIHSYTKYSITK